MFADALGALNTFEDWNFSTVPQEELIFYDTFNQTFKEEPINMDLFPNVDENDENKVKLEAEKELQSLFNTIKQNENSYCDITPYLDLPQTLAAKKIGIPTSTLSKRWKEAVPFRKWPFRTISKIDKEISAILEEIPVNGDVPVVHINKLALLIRKRGEELQPVSIRL